jgi:putative FmdB family regulatory protein
MPTYEFKCEKCNKKFSLILSISEYEKTKFRCPKCKSTKVKQLLTPFQVQTSKKS